MDTIILLWNSIRKRIVSITESFFSSIFKQPFSVGSKKLAKNITYVTVFTVISGILLFIYNVTVVHVLGAAEFGKYTLVLSVSQFFLIPMLFGYNHAATRYVSGEDDPSTVIKTVIQVSGMCMLVSGAVLFFVARPLSTLLQIDAPLFYVSLALSIIIAAATLIKAIAFAKKKFVQFSLLENSMSLVVFAVGIFIIFFLHNRTFFAPLYAYIISSTLLIILALKYVILLRSGTFSKVWLVKLSVYATYSTIGGLGAFVISSSDKLIINHYFSPETLGLYAAYVTASSSIILGRFLGIVINVLFPTLSGVQNKARVSRALNNASFKLIGLVSFLTAIIIYVLFVCYGRQYPYNFKLSILFSLSAGFYFVQQLYGILLWSGDIAHYRKYVMGYSIIGIVNLGANLLLIPRYGLVAAASLSLLTNLVIYVFVRRYSTKVYLSLQSEDGLGSIV